MQGSDDKLLPHGYFVGIFDKESSGHHYSKASWPTLGDQVQFFFLIDIPMVFSSTPRFESALPLLFIPLCPHADGRVCGCLGGPEQGPVIRPPSES